MYLCNEGNRSLLTCCLISGYQGIILPLFDINVIACTCTICCFLKEFRKEIMNMITLYLNGVLFVGLWHPGLNWDRKAAISERDSIHKWRGWFNSNMPYTGGGTTNNSALFFYTKKPPKDSEAQFDKTGRNQIAETFSTASLVVARFSIWMTSAALRLLLSTIWA